MTGTRLGRGNAWPPSVCPDMLYIFTGSNKTRIVGVQNLCRMVRTALYLLKETVGIVV